MSPRPESFAYRLITARHNRGMSKSALARAVDVTPTCVWNWEEGNTEPRSENLSALARTLGVSTVFLESGEVDDALHRPPSSFTAATTPSQLDEVIAESKLRIATAAGRPLDNVRIQIDW